MIKNEINNKNSLLFNLLLMTIFWNIWFPKAGIKISGIPLTIGNVFFIMTFVVWFLKRMRIGKFRINPPGGLILVGIFYFMCRYIIVMLAKNISFSTTIGYIIPLCIYPLIFFLIIELVDSNEKLEKIIKIIVYGFIFLCIYALFQYFLRIETVAIPGLTVNLTDYQQLGKMWYMAKANGTDINNAKIVSTYQNGNLFGISLLLIYPIVYNYFKNKKENGKIIISLLLFIITTFLTLSRACWLGIILFITFGVLMENDNTKEAWLRRIIIIILSCVAIAGVFKFLPSVANRFFGTTNWVSMSGRTEGLIKVFETVFASNNIFAYILGPYGMIKYSGLAYEILPLSIFVQTGIVGIILLYSVFFYGIRKMKSKNYISKAIKLSFIIWLIVGCIECGYWLPPAALNLFMMLGLGIKATDLNEMEK